MNISDRYEPDGDSGGSSLAVGLRKLSLQIKATDDGRVVGATHELMPPHLLPLITSDSAIRHRRRTLTHGPLAYEEECGGTHWSVYWAVVSSSEDGTCVFSCDIENLEARLEARRLENVGVGSNDDLVEILPDVVVITDLEGRLIYANRSAVELLGVKSQRDLIGKAVWTFVHPEEIATARREGRLLEGGKRVEYIRHRVMRQDGESVPVEIVTRRTRYRGKPAFLISAHDLTGLRTIEQALEETQQLFYRVFKTGPLAIVVSRLSSGTIVDANDAFCKLLGKARESIIERTLDEVVERLDTGALSSVHERITLDGSANEVEVQITNGAGRTRTLLVSSSRIDVQGEPCMLSMASDITERKQAVMKLRESEERFRAMADDAPVLIWLSDVEGELTYFNDRWLRFTGRSLQQEVGGRWIEGVHANDRERCRDVFMLSHDRQEGFSIEFRLMHDDGAYRWMLMRAIPRRLLDGSFIGFVGSCVDITDRKMAEQELLQSKQQAEDLTILKSAFLTNMTHEIRTPLTVILGFTSILRQGTKREYQRFVNLIERSGRRLLLMLDSVLDLAQLDAGTLVVEQSRQNIDDIIHSVVATLVPIAEDKHLYLRYDVPESAPYAQLDAAVVARVLNNLLDNAIKFTEQGGVHVSLEEDDAHINIHIKDTGIGISSEFIPHIYDAFSQESTGIERTHQGSGLGMTVSKQLLELLEGELLIESEKGMGSTITVRLPT